MPLLEIVRQRLVDTAVVTSLWPCFIGYSPDDSDQLITLSYTGGFAQETLGSENMRATFQAVVRAGMHKHAVCETKWKALYDALQNASLTGVNMMHALSSGPLTFPDSKNRTCMSVNFSAIVPK